MPDKTCQHHLSGDDLEECPMTNLIPITVTQPDGKEYHLGDMCPYHALTWARNHLIPTKETHGSDQ